MFPVIARTAGASARIGSERLLAMFRRNDEVDDSN